MPTTSDASIVFNFTLATGAEASVVRHMQGPAAWTVALFEDVGDAIENWFNVADGGVNAAKDLFSNQVTLEEVVFTALAGAPQVEYVHEIGIAGTNAGSPVPPETSIVTKWNTGFPGRSFRGRSFWPGFWGSGLDADGLVAAANAVIYGNVMQRLIDDVNTAAASSVAFGVYSRLLDDITPITSVTVRRTPHHQSRRNS